MTQDAYIKLAIYFGIDLLGRDSAAFNYLQHTITAMCGLYGGISRHIPPRVFTLCYSSCLSAVVLCVWCAVSVSHLSVLLEQNAIDFGLAVQNTIAFTIRYLVSLLSISIASLKVLEQPL